MENILTQYNWVKDLHLKGVEWMFIIPIFLMVADVITGYVASWKNHTIKSQKMRDGLVKKVGELVCITFGFVMFWATDIMAFVTSIGAYISFMELVSIFENLDKMDVKVPGFISKRINNDLDTVQKVEIVKEDTKEVKTPEPQNSDKNSENSDM
jgi:toxin secretion/phage lysis holin